MAQHQRRKGAKLPVFGLILSSGIMLSLGFGLGSVISGCGSSDSTFFQTSNGQSNGSSPTGGGNPPTSAKITFMDGAVQRTIDAIPGEIIILAATGVTPQQITTLANSNGATAIEADNDFPGLYLITVPIGSEAAFISAIQGPLVAYFSPNFVVNVSQSGQPQSSKNGITISPLTQGACVQPVVIDDFQTEDPDCPDFTHGDLTKNTTGDGLDGNPLTVDFGSRGKSLMKSIKAALTRAQDAGCSAVLNLSLANDQGTTDQQGVRDNQKKMIEAVAASLEALQGDAQVSATATDAALVMCAGNGVGNRGQEGADLSGILAGLRTDHPSLNDGRLTIVGSSGGPDDECDELNPDKTKNYSSNPGDMVYRQGNQVKVPNTNCTVDGTSFATPQVANEIAKTVRSTGKTPKQVAKELTKCPPDLVGTWSGTDQVTVGECGVNFSAPASVTFSSVTPNLPSTSTGTVSGGWTLPTFSFPTNPCGPNTIGSTSGSFGGTFSNQGKAFQVNFGAAGSGSGSINGKSMTITLQGTSTNGSSVTNVLTLTKT